MIQTQIIKEMIEQAREARENAFALRSEHHIGASVLTDKDEIFAGCNIESNVSGLGICAERCAVNNAVSHGSYSFRAVLVYDRQQIMPCGACLQYLMEFISIKNVEPVIISVNESGDWNAYTLDELLPKTFRSQRGKEKVNSLEKEVL